MTSAPASAPATTTPARGLRVWWRPPAPTLRRLLWLVALAALVLALGVWIGRGQAPTNNGDARAAVEASVLPLVVEADALWTSSSDDRPPIAEALLALRGGDPAPVTDHVEDWQAAYDSLLLRMAGLDLPSEARPVQREFITGVTLARDATVVLAHAAGVNDPDHRTDLVTEASRLRQRSEQVVQNARASTLDLGGARGDVAPLPTLPSFLEGRRG